MSFPPPLPFRPPLQRPLFTRSVPRVVGERLDCATLVTREDSWHERVTLVRNRCKKDCCLIGERKHGGSHAKRHFAIWRAKTRHFGSEKSCHGISATELYWEFCTMHFGFNPWGQKERLYSCCRGRWKVLHARGDSDHRKNGCSQWGMF